MMNIILILLVGLTVDAKTLFTQQEIQSELNAFNNDFIKFSKSLPIKKNNNGHIVDSDYLTAKASEKIFARRKLLTNQESHFSEPKRNDLAQALIEDDQFMELITEMDQGFRSGQTQTQPWSDDYWPHFRGGTGARYADENFPSSTDWKENFDYISKNPFRLVFESGKSDLIDNLSPSEKYDLLIDKNSGALTKSSWSEGEAYFNRYGKVETWMGICHGWAPAAYMSERPAKAVSVLAFDDKTKITFYPDDIKALISLLWANVRTPVRFVGGRCNDQNPDLDTFGRPKNPDCLDNNPSTWHKVVVNRIGVSKRSFILDATWDYQVWNQPVISYTYSYFNPQTLSTVDSLEKAKVKIEDFSKDKFSKYRSPNTQFVVGVAMEVTYAIERRPGHDTPADYTHTVLYTYDLEIDSKENIIGGEWYKMPHPDFLWTPTKDAKALARNDVYLLGQPNWNGKTALPTTWKRHALESAQSTQPLAKIIDSLLELSKENTER